MSNYKDVLKKIASDAIGEEGMQELSKYGKAAVEAGRKTSQYVEKKINESDNDAVKLAKNLIDSTKNTSGKLPNDTYGIDNNSNKGSNKSFKGTKCPSCGAQLEIDDGIDTFYCQYCGAKIVLNNQSDAVVKAKVNAKHKEVMADKVIQYLDNRKEQKAEEEKKRQQRLKKMLPVYLLVLVVLFGALFALAGSTKKKSDAEEVALQAIVEEIQEDISNGKYDEALVKANGLYYTSNYSSETNKKWRSTRETLIEQINDLKKSSQEKDKSNSEQNQNNKALFYTTNDESTAKNGNTGVYAYIVKNAKSYDIYYVINFDEGVVYTFTDGNESGICDRLKIEEGDLNSVLIITYHDGGEKLSYGLHFKWKNQPDHLVVQDESGLEYDYIYTDLDKALKLRDTKEIIDY